MSIYDLRRLTSHQRAFLAAALGGPDIYAGRDLTRADARLNIDDAGFDAVVAHRVQVVTRTLLPSGIQP